MSKVEELKEKHWEQHNKGYYSFLNGELEAFEQAVREEERDKFDEKVYELMQKVVRKGNGECSYFKAEYLELELPQLIENLTEHQPNKENN